jgi:hypothetical protein
MRIYNDKEVSNINKTISSFSEGIALFIYFVSLKHPIVEDLFLLNSIVVLRSWKVVLLKNKRPTDQKEIVG